MTHFYDEDRQCDITEAFEKITTTFILQLEDMPDREEYVLAKYSILKAFYAFRKAIIGYYAKDPGDPAKVYLDDIQHWLVDEAKYRGVLLSVRHEVAIAEDDQRRRDEEPRPGEDPPFEGRRQDTGKARGRGAQ